MTATPRRAVALYRRGRAWKPAVPLRDQPALRAHIDFLGELAREGVLDAGGPFHDMASVVAGTDLVGLVVFRAGDVDAARAVLAEDPALREDVMECEILAWFA